MSSMHSSLSRISTAFGYFTSVAMAVAALVAASVFLSPQTPSASVGISDVKVSTSRHSMTGKMQEYAHLTFNLDTDLSSLYNWNTKQVFAFVTASYPSKDPEHIPPSEVVIWDAVIPANNAPKHKNRFSHPLTTSKSTSKSTSNKKRQQQQKLLPHPIGAQPGILHLENQKPKYRITDISGRIGSQTNVTLTLHWAVQPFLGLMTTTNFQTLGRWQGLQGGRSESFDLPAVGGAKGAGKDPAAGSPTFKKSDLETARGAEVHHLETGQAQRSGSR